MKLLSFALLAGTVCAAPFSLPDGFPNPKPQALMGIQKQAGGTLPNTALPTDLKDDAIQALQVIATNEIFETAYFSTLLDKVTNNDQGYTNFGGLSREYVIDSLKTIRAVSCMTSCGTHSNSDERGPLIPFTARRAPCNRCQCHLVQRWCQDDRCMQL